MPNPANRCRLRPLPQDSSPGRTPAEPGAIDRDGGRLTVAVNDRAIGSVFWFRRIWGPEDTSWCRGIAARIHVNEQRKRHGTEAVELLVRYLFDHKGVLRGTLWREGRWHDQHIYSPLRGDQDA